MNTPRLPGRSFALMTATFLLAAGALYVGALPGEVSFGKEAPAYFALAFQFLAFFTAGLAFNAFLVTGAASLLWVGAIYFIFAAVTAATTFIGDVNINHALLSFSIIALALAVVGLRQREVAPPEARLGRIMRVVGYSIAGTLALTLAVAAASPFLEPLVRNGFHTDFFRLLASLGALLYVAAAFLFLQVHARSGRFTPLGLAASFVLMWGASTAFAVATRHPDEWHDVGRFLELLGFLTALGAFLAGYVTSVREERPASGTPEREERPASPAASRRALVVMWGSTLAVIGILFLGLAPGPLADLRWSAPLLPVLYDLAALVAVLMGARAFLDSGSARVLLIAMAFLLFFLFNTLLLLSPDLVHQHWYLAFAATAAALVTLYGLVRHETVPAGVRHSYLAGHLVAAVVVVIVLFLLVESGALAGTLEEGRHGPLIPRLALLAGSLFLLSALLYLRLYGQTRGMVVLGLAAANVFFLGTALAQGLAVRHPDHWHLLADFMELLGFLTLLWGFLSVYRGRVSEE